VDLQSDSAVLKLSALGVVGELRSEFVVDEELEVVSACDDSDVVPIVCSDIRQLEGPWDSPGICPAVPADDQPRPALAGIFLAPGEVEIPCAEDVRADPDVSEVGVIALKRPLSGQIGLTADLDAGVAVARQAIPQLKLKVGKMLILPDEISEPVGAAGPDNRSITNGPVRRAVFRDGMPAIERLAVERIVPLVPATSGGSGQN